MSLRHSNSQSCRILFHVGNEEPCFFLQFAQIKLISKAYTNPGKATTKTFEKELLRVMRLAVEARIPEKEGEFLHSIF